MFGFTSGDDCVQRVEIFTDAVVQPCNLTLQFNFISYGNWMAYTFNEVEGQSVSSQCGFVDVCLNADKGANIKQGECGAVNEYDNFIFTLVNCDTEDVFTAYMVNFNNSIINPNVTVDRTCNDICNIKILDPSPTAKLSLQSDSSSLKSSLDSMQTIFDPRIQKSIRSSYPSHNTISSSKFVKVCVNWTNTDPLDSSTSSSTQSPTPVTTTPVTSTPTPAVKSPPPPIQPPDLPPRPDNTTCESNAVIGIFCNVTDGNTNAAQALHQTSNIINNTTISSTDTYYIGAIIYFATRNATNLDSATVTNTLDIINKIGLQPIDILKNVIQGYIHENANRDNVPEDTIQRNYLLWYPATITNLIGISQEAINYSHSNSSIFVRSWNILGDCTSNVEKLYCFDKNNKLLDDESSESFCITVKDQNDICNSIPGNRYIMITPVQFYILGNNAHGEGIEFDTDTNSNGDQGTYKDVPKCTCGNCPISGNSANMGWVNNNRDPTSVELKIRYYHSKAINDLHRKPYIGIFDKTYFVAGPEMVRENGLYEKMCNSSQCTIYFNGCSSDFITCNIWFKLIVAIGIPIGIIYIMYKIVYIAYKTKNVPRPACVNFMCFITTNFRKTKLKKKANWFSLIYGIMFTIFLCLILLGNKNYVANDTACDIIAGISHFTYLACVMLSILNVFIASQPFDNWKKWYKVFLSVVVGTEKQTFWPLIVTFAIPLAITGTFALTMPEFLQRNDDFCWIRSDYKFEALWVPVIMLICTIPFYIPLLAHYWSTSCLTTPVNKLFVDDSAPFQNSNNSNENDETKKKKPEECNLSYICFRLFIPQILIGLPIIADSFALHAININFASISFVIFLGCHMLLYAIFRLLLNCKNRAAKKERERNGSSNSGGNQNSGWSSRNTTYSNRQSDSRVRSRNRSRSFQQPTLGEMDRCEGSVTRGGNNSQRAYFTEEPIIPRAHIEVSRNSQESSLRHESSIISSPSTEQNSREYRPSWHTEQYETRSPETNNDNYGIPPDWDISEDEDNGMWRVDERRAVPLRNALIGYSSSPQRIQNYDNGYNQSAVKNGQFPRVSMSSNQSSQQFDTRTIPKKYTSQQNQRF